MPIFERSGTSTKNKARETAEALLSARADDRAKTIDAYELLLQRHRDLNPSTKNKARETAEALLSARADDRAKAEEDYKNEYLDEEIRPEHAISNDIQQQHADSSGFVSKNTMYGAGAREHEVYLPHSAESFHLALPEWPQRLPSVVNHETTHAYDPMVRVPGFGTPQWYKHMKEIRSKYFGRDRGNIEMPAMAVQEATSMRQFPKTVPADTNLRRAMLKYAPGTADVVKSSPEIWKFITALRSGKGPYRPPGASSPYSYGAGQNEHDPAQNLQAAYKNWVNFQRRGMPDKARSVDRGPGTAGPNPYPGKDPATKRWSDKNIPKIDDGKVEKAWRADKEGAVRAGFLAGYIPNNLIT